MSDISKNYGKCPSCQEYSVHLCTSGPIDFFGDQDNDAGEESQYHDIEAPMRLDVELYAHICMECGHIVDVGLSSPESRVIYQSK